MRKTPKNLVETQNAQLVEIHKNTTVQGFSVEQELERFVSNGEMSLVLKSEAFARRNDQEKLNLMCDTLSYQIKKLEKHVNDLSKGGQETWSTTVTVIHEIRALQDYRTRLTKGFYDGSMRFIPSKTGVKIDFY